MSRPGIGVQILQYVVPDRRNGRGNGGTTLFDHLDQPWRLQEPIGQQQVGAGHHGGVRLTPGVRVEHGDDR